MSYDTKAQKNRPQLENGAALSTLVFEPVAGPDEAGAAQTPDEERENDPPAGHERGPADESSSEKDR